MRILVCDDNADAAETLRVLLASDGHEVIALSDSRACLEKALEWVPEVAFLDVGMPGLTGYALARQIRARFGRRILELGGSTFASGLFLGFLTYASALSAPAARAFAMSDLELEP